MLYKICFFVSLLLPIRYYTASCLTNFNMALMLVLLIRNSQICVVACCDTLPITIMHLFMRGSAQTLDVHIDQARCNRPEYTPGRSIPGVTGQNIPPAGVYPGILWPRPIYTPGDILA